MYGHASERDYLKHLAEMHKADPKTALSLSEQIDLFTKDLNGTTDQIGD